MLDTELAALKARNARVERDKAWETSWVRRGFIMLITYLIAALYMEIAGLGNALVGAFVPVGGYLLSTLSLPVVKQAWVKKHFPETENK